MKRWTRLVAGLFLYGVAVALMMRGQLGLGPWDAFHLGLHNITGISVGGASIAAGVLIVLGSLLIGIRPGWGTIANMVLIGLFVDLLLPIVPAAASRPWGLAYHLGGIAASGLATGMYISAGLGKGPRDGLMLGLSQRFGWPVRRVRTGIELGVLGAGWLMGGTIGAGTILFALTIGPATQWGLQLFGLVPAGGAAPAEPEPGPDTPADERPRRAA